MSDPQISQMAQIGPRYRARREEAIRLGLPPSSVECLADGWAVDWAFLRRVREAVVADGYDDASEELVEAVLMAAGRVRHGAGSSVDAGAGEQGAGRKSP